MSCDLRGIINEKAQFKGYLNIHTTQTLYSAGENLQPTIGSQLTARYWLLVAVLTVQFIPHTSQEAHYVSIK
jgi:hypothetical protein